MCFEFPDWPYLLPLISTCFDEKRMAPEMLKIPDRKHVFYYFILIPHQFFWFNFFPFEAEALKKTLLLKIHKGGFIIRVRWICDVAFNIAISSQRRRTLSLTIASENFRHKDNHKLSQQSWNYFNLLVISLPWLSNCHLKSEKNVIKITNWLSNMN